MGFEVFETGIWGFADLKVGIWGSEVFKTGIWGFADLGFNVFKTGIWGFADLKAGIWGSLPPLYPPQLNMSRPNLRHGSISWCREDYEVLFLIVLLCEIVYD